MYALIYCIGVFLSDLLCIIGSSFIYLIRTDSNAFFLIAEKYSIVYTYHKFLIHASADGHLCCFHALAIIVNSAAMDIGVHVSFAVSYTGLLLPSF